MSKQIDDGGPAFPRIGEASMSDGKHVCDWHGMSLRDWFAGQALAGMLGNKGCNTLTNSEIAQEAFNLADAMIEARKEAK